jgi:hypothetical protein
VNIVASLAESSVNELRVGRRSCNWDIVVDSHGTRSARGMFPEDGHLYCIVRASEKRFLSRASTREMTSGI